MDTSICQLGYFKPHIPPYDPKRNENSKTPEQIKVEEERRSLTHLLNNLMNSIRILSVLYVPYNVGYGTTDYNQLDNNDKWKSEVDRLSGLLKKMKMSEIESVQSQIFAWVNGHNCANFFAFKIEDSKGKIYMFNCEVQNFERLTRTIKRVVWESVKINNPTQILYEDDDGEKIVIASDSDLTEAVNYARSVGREYLSVRLDMNCSLVCDFSRMYQTRNMLNQRCEWLPSTFQ